MIDVECSVCGRKAQTSQDFGDSAPKVLKLVCSRCNFILLESQFAHQDPQGVKKEMILLNIQEEIKNGIVWQGEGRIGYGSEHGQEELRAYESLVAEAKAMLGEGGIDKR